MATNHFEKNQRVYVVLLKIQVLCKFNTLLAQYIEFTSDNWENPVQVGVV